MRNRSDPYRQNKAHPGAHTDRLRCRRTYTRGVGLYSPLVKWAGAGATVPLTGFGSTLAKGVEKAVSEVGVLGAFTGGFTAAAAGIGATVFFGIIIALLFRPKAKS